MLLEGIRPMIKKNTKLKSTSSTKAASTATRRQPNGEAADKAQHARWKYRILSEARKAPIAITAAVAAVALALVPFAVVIIDKANDDDVIIQVLPVRLAVGQSSSPSAVTPDHIPDSDLPPLDNAKFKEWARKHKAVYANRLEVSFITRSDSTQQIAIRDARVVVIERKAPMSGTWIEPTGAGPGPNRVLWANLDDDPPTISTDGGWEFPLVISQSEMEAFTVIAQVENCYCMFRIELEYIDAAGTLKTATVDDDGRPFAVTSTQNAKEKVHAR
jgi:hypothetical protein